MIDYDFVQTPREIYDLKDNLMRMAVRKSNALSILFQFGQGDGTHHKAWVIDQVLRALCGCEYDIENECFKQNQEYQDWVHYYCYVDGELEYDWDCGVAP